MELLLNDTYHALQAPLRTPHAGIYDPRSIDNLTFRVRRPLKPRA